MTQMHDSTGTAGATARLPGTWSIGLRRVRIELLQFARDREAAFFTMLLPVLLLIVFGSAFTGNVAPGIRFSQYFLAGMLASGIVYTSFQNLAISIPQERDDGTLKRLQGTPMPKASYFVGKVGLVLVIYVVQVVVMMAVGVTLFDVHLPSSLADWWTFTWVSVLGLLCCTLPAYRAILDHPECPRPGCSRWPRCSRSSGCARGCARCSCPTRSSDRSSPGRGSSGGPPWS